MRRRYIVSSFSPLKSRFKRLFSGVPEESLENSRWVAADNADLNQQAVSSQRTDMSIPKEDLKRFSSDNPS